MMNVQQLVAAIERGEVFRYHFFYSRVFPFSQWWAEPFVVDGVTYPTAEHYMMAEKARVFGDRGALAAILATQDPGRAKSLGRSVRNFDEREWVSRREGVILRGNHAKFSQSETLRRLLLDTKDVVLVEASPSDRIYGIGLEDYDPRAKDPRRWKGMNLLGFALMEVREGLRAEAPPASEVSSVTKISLV